MESDWRRAEELVTAALALESGLAPPQELLAAIQRLKDNSAIQGALEEAERIGRAGDLRGALSVVDRALKTYPDEPQLLHVQQGLSEEIRKAREFILSELRRIQEELGSIADLEELEPIKTQLNAIAAANARDAEIRQLAEDLVAAARSREK